MSDTCLQTGTPGQLAVPLEIFRLYIRFCFLLIFFFVIAFAFLGLWLQVVCLTKGKKKISGDTLSPLLPATIFDTLHGNRSNQVKL